MSCCNVPYYTVLYYYSACALLTQCIAHTVHCSHRVHDAPVHVSIGVDFLLEIILLQFRLECEGHIQPKGEASPVIYYMIEE